MECAIVRDQGQGKVIDGEHLHLNGPGMNPMAGRTLQELEKQLNA